MRSEKGRLSQQRQKIRNHLGSEIQKQGTDADKNQTWKWLIQFWKKMKEQMILETKDKL